MNLRLQSQERKLDSLFLDVSKIDESDVIKSHLSKYLCIQVSGFLENVVKELISEFHETSCRKETKSYVSNKLKSLTNLENDKLCKFLQLFDNKWRDIYDASVQDAWIQSLNSVVSQRNLIAHGNSSGSNITYYAIFKYYNDLKEIIKILEKIIK